MHFSKEILHFVILINILAVESRPRISSILNNSLFDPKNNDHSITKPLFEVIIELFVKNLLKFDFCFDDDEYQYGNSFHFIEKLAKYNQNYQFTSKVIRGEKDYGSTYSQRAEGVWKTVTEAVLFKDDLTEVPEYILLNMTKVLIVTRAEIKQFEIILKKQYQVFTDFVFRQLDYGYVIDYLYFFVYSETKGYLVTMDRFVENSCKDYKFIILNEFDIKSGKWKFKLDVPEKFTNFHKCPLFLTNSNKPGMKLLYELIDGIVRKHNASLEFKEFTKLYAVHYPTIVRNAPDSETEGLFFNYYKFKAKNSSLN
jgi:hypothetical protein